MMSPSTRITLPFAAAVVLFAAGCGTGSKNSLSPAVANSTHRLQGNFHGGQQPVSGVTVQLYAVSASGYYQAAMPLLAQPAMSDQNGGFTLPAYSCAGVDQVYLVGTGGNPGLAAGTNNPALALMAALGSCANLLKNADTTFITVNELTTVAAAWSLAHFMSGPATAGTSSGNPAGVVNAFAGAAKVVDTSSGTMPGPMLPAGATLPVNEINSLADILAYCVNSTGDTSNANSPCAVLFSAATPPGGSAPADTITAALNIARFPANNVASLYVLATPSGPFQPTLRNQPDNWLVAIRYTGGGLNHPGSLAIDAANNVWATNSSANSVSEFANSGLALSPSSGFTDPSLAAPSAVAADATGNAWVTNAGANSVTRIAPQGASFASYTGGGLSAPSAIAIDGFGNVFITNKSSATITELSSSGAILSTTPYSGAGLNLPSAIAINAQ